MTNFKVVTKKNNNFGDKQYIPITCSEDTVFSTLNLISNSWPYAYAYIAMEMYHNITC